MKKTTVRFAAVGTILLLGALAIALAQHDSRQRPHETPFAAKPVGEAPQPILVDAIDPTFHGSSHSSSTGPANSGQGSTGQGSTGQGSSGQGSSAETGGPLVRANDDAALTAPPSLAYDSDSAAGANRLQSPSPSRAFGPDRAAPLGALDDNSAVEQASGEDGALGLPAIPPLSGTLGAKPLPPDSLSSDSLPANSLPPSPPSLSSPLPDATLPAAPSLSSPASASPNAATGELPAAPPGWVNSGAIAPKQSLSQQSLSDTQRPAMPATSLAPATRGGEQPWLQASPMPSRSPNAGGANGAVLPGTAGIGTAGMSAVGTSPAAASMTGAAPSSAGTHSRLSDMPESPAAVGTARPQLSPPSMPGAVAGSPGLGTPPPQPLAPSSPAENMLTDSALNSSSSGAFSPPQPMGSVATQPRGQLASASGRSLLAGTALGSLISNQPGNRQLDGSQNPIMLIQKRMAGECQVGKRATIVITVRNSGNATAHDVQVIDSVPSGASFAEAMPAVTQTPEGVLVWQLGEMAPGDERTINLQIIPERQGELGSVASVRFAAQASVRTLATLPKVELTYTAAPDVLIGSQHPIDVVVKNVGTGVARNVRLEADLPANIRHESGDPGLEASFGDIAPGESKQIRLEAIAAEAGTGACSIRALTDDGLQQEQKVAVNVLAPALQATINGPSKRYLDRQATFAIAIKNTGTAPATNCEFVLRLPAGLNFNTANNRGTYDPDQHAVLWSLPELPAGQSGSVELTVLPVEIGTLAMTFQAAAELGVKAEARGELTVEEQAELAFTIEQDADPIELSASTTYTVEIRNVGRVDHNVQLIAQLPPGSKLLKVDAPVKYSIQGDQLLFEPVPQMDSRTGHKFRFEVQHAQAGTQIVRAQLKSQNRPTPVIKEEATDVYNDRN